MAALVQSSTEILILSEGHVRNRIVCIAPNIARFNASKTMIYTWSRNTVYLYYSQTGKHLITSFVKFGDGAVGSCVKGEDFEYPPFHILNLSIIGQNHLLFEDAEDRSICYITRRWRDASCILPSPSSPGQILFPNGFCFRNNSWWSFDPSSEAMYSLSCPDPPDFNQHFPVSIIVNGKVFFVGLFKNDLWIEAIMDNGVVAHYKMPAFCQFHALDNHRFILDVPSKFSICTIRNGYLHYLHREPKMRKWTTLPHFSNEGWVYTVSGHQIIPQKFPCLLPEIQKDLHMLQDLPKVLQEITLSYIGDENGILQILT